MRPTLDRSALTVSAFALATLSLVSFASVNAAPQEPAAGSSSARRTGSRQARTGTTVGQVVRKISEGAGVQVVADSTVAGLEAKMPEETTTPQNFEQQLADLARTLGHGTTWAKLFLPAPTEGSAGYKGDDVAAYATAQARLFGRVGDAPSGSVEILGKTLPAAQADPYVAGLNLKPVYLLSNPRTAAAAEHMQQQWAGMSEDQRQQYAQQQAARLARADNPTRQAWMQEHMAVMGQLMRQLTPEQRNAMLGGNGNVRVFVSGTPAQSANGAIQVNGDQIIIKRIEQQ